MALQDALYLLDQLGFTDVFLPFILIFTIIFAVLQKVQIFGTDSKKFNSVISLAVAIGVVIPHSLGKYPPGTDIVDIINSALPNVSLVIVALVFVLVLIGMFGGAPVLGGNWISGLITIIALGIVTYIFGNAAGWWQTTGALSFLSDPNVQATIIILAVFWLIISVITKGENEPGGLERVGELFGGAMREAAKPSAGKTPEQPTGRT